MKIRNVVPVCATVALVGTAGVFAAAPANAAPRHPYTLTGHATLGGSPEFVTVRMAGCARPPVVHAESADGMADNFTVTRPRGHNRYTGPMIFGRYDETGWWHITMAACAGRHGHTIRIRFPHPSFPVTR